MTQWPAACQAPPSVEFPRQCWSQLPRPPQGILSNQGSNPHLLHWQADSLHLSHKSPYIDHYISINIINTTEKKILKKKTHNTIIQSVFTGNVYGLNSSCWVPPTNSWQTSMTPSLTHQIVLHYSIWFCMDYFTEHIYKDQFLCTSANFLLFCVLVSFFILFLLLINYFAVKLSQQILPSPDFSYGVIY